MHLPKLIAFLLFSSLMIASVNGQEEYIYNLNKSRGLPSNEVYDMTFLRNNQILLATDLNVFLYDGANFTEIKLPKEEVGSIYKLFQIDGDIHGITLEGVYEFKPKELRFVKSQYDNLVNSDKFHCPIINRVIDTKDTVFFCPSHSTGFIKLVKNTHEVILVNGLLTDRIKSKGLYINDYGPERFLFKQHYNKFQKDVYESSNQYFKNALIKKDAPKAFGQRMNVVNLSEKRKLISLGNILCLTNQDSLLSKIEYDDKILNIAVFNDLILVGFRSSGMKVLSLSTFEEKSQFLGDLSVTDFEKEDSGLIWVSTIQKGVYRINLHLDKVISDESVQSLFVDSSLYYSNEQFEIFRYSLKKKNIVDHVEMNYPFDLNTGASFQNALEYKSSNFYSGSTFTRVMSFSGNQKIYSGRGSTLMKSIEDSMSFFQPNIPIRGIVRYAAQQAIGCGHETLMLLNVSSLDSKSIHTSYSFRTLYKSKDGGALYGGVRGVIVEMHQGDTTEIVLPDDNSVIKISEVGKGEIWIATKKHLFRYINNTFYCDANDLDEELNDFHIYNGFVWIGTKTGVYKKPISDFSRDVNRETHFLAFMNNNKKVFEEEGKDLLLNIELSRYGYDSEKIKFRYQLKGDWIETTNRKINLNNLNPGEYKIQVQCSNIYGKWGDVREVQFTVLNPIWMSWWFILILVSLFLILVVMISMFFINQVKRKKNREIERLHLEQNALKAQMNPHFTFNSLNSAMYFVIKDEKDKAINYLSKFSRLLRTSLDHSNEEVVSLESELEHLKLYLEIEASRFEEVFEYEIKYSDQLNLAKVKIPPMLIQPLVENSIWHGLQDVDREKKILIEIIEELNYLKIIIDDNGKGVSDSFIDNDKKSYGILNTKKRIELFNLGKINEAFEFIDKKKVSREDGVKVIMKLIRK